MSILKISIYCNDNVYIRGIYVFSPYLYILQGYLIYQNEEQYKYFRFRRKQGNCYQQQKLNINQKIRMNILYINFIIIYTIIFLQNFCRFSKEQMSWIQYPFYFILISYFVIEAIGSIQCLVEKESDFKRYEIYLFSVEIFMYILSTGFIFNHVWYQYQIDHKSPQEWRTLNYISYPRIYSAIIVATLTLNIISMVGEILIYIGDKQDDLLLCTVFEQNEQSSFSEIYYWIVFSLDIISMLYLVKINLRVLAYEKQPGTFYRSVKVTLIGEDVVQERQLNFIQKYFLYECQICFQGFKSGEQLIRYMCRHKFHSYCIGGSDNQVLNTCFICDYGTPRLQMIL
ncbi:hypothetical protein pb186bvf_017917 [Paramecium bursaria]